MVDTIARLKQRARSDDLVDALRQLLGRRFHLLRTARAALTVR